MVWIVFMVVGKKISDMGGVQFEVDGYVFDEK